VNTVTIWFARAACLMAILLTSGIFARADELADFNTAVEALSVHNRTAIGYLRTENVDLASLEVERLRDAWTRFTERFAGNRPHAFDGSALYGNLFTTVNARLVGADLMLKIGRPDAARISLDGIRKDLYDLRKASGVVVLADCIRDANAKMDDLMVYDNRALDLKTIGTTDEIANKASAYGSVLDRCDRTADDTVRISPEFRRLVDGTRASLAQIPKAIATHDDNLLHRVLIELRSFDNLLDFRFG
jgi:hypothetical protein